MASTPDDNSAFMREVDDEVRKQQAADFWQRWGRWIAGLVIVALAAFGGWLYWSNSQRTAAEDEVIALREVLESLNDEVGDDADQRLAAFADSSRPGVRATAMLSRADVALQQGDNAQAVEYFGQVAGDESLPQPYRDLALIRQTAAEFETLEPQAVIDRLAGLAQPGTPWFGSAGELTALAMMQLEQNDEAGALWAQIANDETVPETLRTRAVQIAGVLGVDAVPDEPVDMDEEQQSAGAAPAATAQTETVE